MAVALKAARCYSLVGSNPTSAADGHYPTGEGAALIRRYAWSDSMMANRGVSPLPYK